MRTPYPLRKTTHEDAEASAQSHANAELQNEEMLKEAIKKDDAASETRRRGWNLQGGKDAAEALWEVNPGEGTFFTRRTLKKKKKKKKKIFFLLLLFRSFKYTRLRKKKLLFF